MRLDAWRVLAAGCLAIWSCGCAVGGSHPTPQPRVVEVARPEPDLGPVTADLELMNTLSAADPVQQAATLQAVKDALASAPTSGNQLKMALALGTPGHSGSDAVAARRQLAELLATPDTLLPLERLLAQVQLQDVDQRLVLQSENAQLRDEAPRETRDKLAAINRRLTAESDENARLRKALEAAQAKLDAVTHVERSINDRGPNGSHP